MGREAIIIKIRKLLVVFGNKEFLFSLFEIYFFFSSYIYIYIIIIIIGIKKKNIGLIGRKFKYIFI